MFRIDSLVVLFFFSVIAVGVAEDNKRKKLRACSYVDKHGWDREFDSENKKA